MDNGWIKLYRILLDKYIWQNSTPEQKVILITLLLMANHEPFAWRWKGKDYEVQRGQFITSINSIVERCGKGISIQNARSSLNKFQKLDFLTIEPTNENTLVTITNWELYQPKEDELTSKPTETQQSTNREVTTNKNDKNERTNKDTKVSMSNGKHLDNNINYENIIKFFNSETKGVFGYSRYPIGTKRQDAIRARIREHGKDAFKEMVKKATKSDFLKGDNKAGFKASIDWLIKPSNYQKTLEGNYDNKGQSELQTKTNY